MTFFYTNPFRSLDKSLIQSILVRVPNWIGDAVMALPALEALRGNFPRARIVVLAKPWVMPLFEDHPGVDAVMSYQKDAAFPRALGSIMRTGAAIRGMRFDLAVLFQNAFEAALLAKLGGIRWRLGYNTDGRGFLLSHSVPRNKEHRHQVDYYLGILRAMGWNAESRDPCLHVSETRASSARLLLRSFRIEDKDHVLGIGPGAAYGPAKRWPAERFASVAEMAGDKWGAKVVILGSAGEAPIGDAVLHAMRRPGANLCGRTDMGEAAAVLHRCRAFVTNDSGLMHVAAALGTPTVAVFGSTDPVATGPRSRRARVVRHPTPCSPCLKTDCTDGYRCLVSIQPEDIWKELEKLWEEEI